MRVLSFAGLAAAGVLLLASFGGGLASSPTGSVLARVDYEYPSPNGVDPNKAGWQCADNTSSDGATRGMLTASTTTYDSGRHSGEILDPPTDPNASFGRSACEVLIGHTIKTGQDIYFGLAVRFPTSWSGHDAFATHVSLAFLEYVGMEGPIELDAYRNRVALSLASGNCVSGEGCAYDNSCGGECIGHSNNVRCIPAPKSRSRGVKGCKVIPAGQLRRGIWNQMIIHVRETPYANGVIEAWWKRKGESSWSKTVTMTGMPTLELGTNDFGQVFDAGVYNAGTSNESDKFGLQDRDLTGPVSINQDDECVATSFAAAVSCFGQAAAR